MTDTAVEMVMAGSAHWPPERRAAMLDSLRAERTRVRVRTRYRDPADVAAAVVPKYVVTPALRLIATAVETVLRSPRRLNLMVTVAPQEGKSTLVAVGTPLRALQHSLDTAVVLATYADALAERHSRSIRELIRAHGSGVVDPYSGMPVEDRLGLRLERGADKVSEWSVEGGRGGLVAVGTGSGLTGRPADLLIIDDPVKNAQDADSKLQRDRVWDWYNTVAQTRLSPSASTLLVQTRWHADDLAGRIIAQQRELAPADRTWRVINIPAISEDGIPDALGRAPGVPMVSARDTAEAKRDFAAIRRDVGDRTWFALYQGSPRNPRGGLFEREWFDASRVNAAPDHPTKTMVAVDPADSGSGDEAGVLAGARTADGRVVLTHDRSARMTADQWARTAVTLALEVGARELAVEAYTAATTYAAVVRRAYTEMHTEATVRAAKLAAIAHVTGDERWRDDLTAVERAALSPTAPFRVTLWRGASKADSVARSSALRQAVETGRAFTVAGAMATFEDQACDWQAGQHQPDRVAAAVILHDRLRVAAPPTVTPPPAASLVDPGRPTARPTTAAARLPAPAAAPAWMTRSLTPRR